MSRSSYPEQIDSDVELPRVDDNVTEMGSEAINSVRDAIFAIERAIGVNPQGNLSSLVARINNVIDEDGTIRTAALEDKGLVTLPITNVHIASSAAIQESKLDLDYGTTFLYGRTVSNATDIDALRGNFNTTASQSAGHYSGTQYRHDGNAIDMVSPIRSSDNVEVALHAIDDALVNHEQSSTAHAAYDITVSNEFKNMSVTNVQDALNALDNSSASIIDSHQDTLHDNAVSINSAGHQGSQGNLSETIAASTIYQTDTLSATNILQVMRPNVARITSKDMDLGLLEIGAVQNLRIQAGGVDRGTLDIDLSSVIPTYSVDDVVAAINQAAHDAGEHYPISAYNIGGKITIAHNIPGQEFTLEILSSISFSAATALGFGDVVNTTFYWSNNLHKICVGGQDAVDFKPLLKFHHSHTNPTLNTIVPGLGNLASFGLIIGNEGRVLCNITNHSTTPTDNGTHYILSYPTAQTFVLSSNIQNGEFDIEIVADSVNFQNSSSGQIFDIFAEYDADGYGTVSKSLRASYGPISGVSIAALSEDFPTSNVEWQISDASIIRIHQGSYAGNEVNIPTGFVGQLKVFAPDNVRFALCEVSGNPSSAMDTVSVYDFAGTDEKMYLSSVHYSGNFGLATLKYVTDRRNIGGSVENKTYNTVSQLPLEESIRDLRNNGIVYGFDIEDYSSSDIRIRGGRAYIDGRKLDVKGQIVSVNDLSASRKLLLLDRYGNFIIKDEGDAGYSFEELIEGDAYGDARGLAPIIEFQPTGTALDGYFTDRRFMIGKLDKRTQNKIDALSQRITEIENSASGSFWGFTIATTSGAVSSLTESANTGFTAIDATGFSITPPSVTTRKFEFTNVSLIKTDIFRPKGLTHINILLDIEYTGENSNPFGTSGEVDVNIGAKVTIGVDSVHTYESYVTVKTIDSDVLPSNSAVERYVVSIPVADLSLDRNIMFDIVPRVEIIGSLYVDGGSGGDIQPKMNFNNVKIVTSSYSIAGDILNEDGTSVGLATTIGDVL